MIKKIFKLAAYSAIVFAVVATGAIFAFRAMYPPEKLKEIATNKAKQYLRRQIDFKTISIGLSGLKMETFSMSQRPTFNEGIMLKAGEISIMPKILPLFRGKVEM
ncbi:MAG TPA: hypothetical protein VMW66_05075, partial [Elusimicrobiales bacterium]|nr:hypothetical protein [Elusimicrobiales bacterium]